MLISALQAEAMACVLWRQWLWCRGPLGCIVAVTFATPEIRVKTVTVSRWRLWRRVVSSPCWWRRGAPVPFDPVVLSSTDMFRPCFEALVALVRGDLDDLLFASRFEVPRPETRGHADLSDGQLGGYGTWFPEEA